MFHQLWSALLGVMKSWHQSKLFIEHLVAFSHDSIHILAGVLLWLTAGLLLRRPLTTLLPWLCVLVAITWNETVDLVLERWPDSVAQPRCAADANPLREAACQPALEARMPCTQFRDATETGSSEWSGSRDAVRWVHAVLR